GTPRLVGRRLDAGQRNTIERQTRGGDGATRRAEAVVEHAEPVVARAGPVELERVHAGVTGLEPAFGPPVRLHDQKGRRIAPRSNLTPSLHRAGSATLPPLPRF